MPCDLYVGLFVNHITTQQQTVSSKNYSKQTDRRCLSLWMEIDTTENKRKNTRRVRIFFRLCGVGRVVRGKPGRTRHHVHLRSRVLRHKAHGSKHAKTGDAAKHRSCMRRRINTFVSLALVGKVFAGFWCRVNRRVSFAVELTSMPQNDSSPDAGSSDNMLAHPAGGGNTPAIEKQQTTRPTSKLIILENTRKGVKWYNCDLLCSIWIRTEDR